VDGVCAKSDEHGAGLVAMNAVGSMASSGPDDIRRAFIKALWESEIPSGKWRYYHGVLQVFAILHLSGNFKVYL